ncbi:MAG: tetratricopeptide repeat protein [Elusimicrobia bacterium]|nr:tetratricopeptide repeat protein [Elusimicrobiota bacterium]
MSAEAKDALLRAKRLVAATGKDAKGWKNHRCAQELLQAALDEDPGNTALLTALGAVLSDRGFHKKAAEVLEKARKLGSQDRNTYYNLAVALMNLEQHDRAMRWFKKASDYRVADGTWEAYFDPHGY